MDDLTVGRVAELVGVSVRTLHHWDEIGLVRPSRREWTEYRRYDGDDVARIQRVLVYREVGLPLAEIAALLDDPTADEAAHLDRQRRLLTDRITRLQEMVSAVDRLKEARAMNTPLTPQQRAEIFGTDWNPEWHAEAERRWGSTEQWAESERRTAGMTAQEWTETKAATEAFEADLAGAFRRGVAADAPEAAELARRHRAEIGRFYACTPAMQACLARMYVGDPRFTEHYDRLEPGLTAWLRDVIFALVRSEGVDPETAEWG